jgi:hypothetical protein
LYLDAEGAEANDEIYFNDQSDASGQTYAISNELEPLVTLPDGTPWHFDTTTVERSGMANVYYRRFETVVLNAGEGDDTVNLQGTHREQDPNGGNNSTFTVNGGAGNDTINVGQPVSGGFSLAGFFMEMAAATVDSPR